MLGRVSARSSVRREARAEAKEVKAVLGPGGKVHKVRKRNEW